MEGRPANEATGLGSRVVCEWVRRVGSGCKTGRVEVEVQNVLERVEVEVGNVLGWVEVEVRSVLWRVEVEVGNVLGRV